MELNMEFSLKNKFATNPFIIELKGKMYLQPRSNTVIAQNEAIVNEATGNITERGAVLIGRKRIVDKSQFAKIYASEIGILFELSKPAINVFLYLTKVMDYENKGYLNYNLDYKKLGYTNHKQSFKGIKELIRKKIIAPAIMLHYYWLNPTIVCKGERFAVYQEFIKSPDPIKYANKTISDQIKEERSMLDEKTKNKIDLAENKYKQRSLFDDIE